MNFEAEIQINSVIVAQPTFLRGGMQRPQTYIVSQLRVSESAAIQFAHAVKLETLSPALFFSIICTVLPIGMSGSHHAASTESRCSFNMVGTGMVRGDIHKETPI